MIGLTLISAGDDGQMLGSAWVLEDLEFADVEATLISLYGRLFGDLVTPMGPLMAAAADMMTAPETAFHFLAD